MKTLAWTLIVACSGLQAVAQEKLPSAAEVFDKYVDATGGKPAIEKVTSRVSKGTIEIITFGSSGTFEQYVKAPGKLINISSFAGYGDVIQAVDGKTGWASMPDSGMRDMAEQELKLYGFAADLQHVLHMTRDYDKVAVTGKAKVGENDAYVVEASSAGLEQKMYFCTKSGLMLKAELRPAAGPAIVTEFQDYKDADGMKLPHTMKQQVGEMSMVIKLAEVKHNVPIDDAKFAKPAK